MKKLLFYFTILLFISHSGLSADIYPFTYPESNMDGLKWFLEKPTSTLRIATYTFADNGISLRLKELMDENVSVKILLEPSPVGTKPDENLLCWFEAQGAEVGFYDGPGRYMHAKYIVSDNLVFVSTENIGRQRNRGWGIITNESDTVSEFSSVFDSDFFSASNFSCGLANFTLPLPSFDREFSELPVYSGEVSAFFAPENAVENILKFIGSANESLYIEQFYIYYWRTGENPFLEAAIGRARNGVDVKILLDSSQENEKSRETYQYINNVASKEGLNLEARFIDLKKLRINRLHAKTGIADNKTVMISSVNWNENSPTNNREAGVIVENSGVGEYFAEVFEKDWVGERLEFEKEVNANLVFIILAVIFGVCVAIVKKRVKKSSS